MSVFSAAQRLASGIENLADPYTPATVTPDDSVWRYLRSNLTPLRKVITYSLVFTVCAAMIEVWLIGYAGRLIDTLADIKPDLLWETYGWQFAGVVMLLLVLRPVLHFAREGTNDMGLKPNAATLFRWRAQTHVGLQSVGWFRSRLAGQTATRVVDVGSDAAGAIYSALNAVSYVGVYLIGTMALMGSADARLLVPIVLWLVLYAFIMRQLIPRFDYVNEQFQAARSAMTGHLVDSYSNIDTVKLFADSSAQDRDARDHIEAVRQAFFDLQRVEVTINIAVTVLEGLIMVGLVGYTIVLWQTGAASLGLVAAALALTFKITSMIEWFMGAVSSIFSHVGSLREELRTIAQPIAVVDVPKAAKLAVTGGSITYRNVSHHYGKGAGGVDRVSLTVGAGEKIGLVGPSGAGKSTLVNLLLRFHDAESGSIEIDGQDIRTVAQDSLRSHIGMVAQEAALLHRSVLDNITFGRGDVTLSGVEHATRQAQAYDFIQGLRDGQGRQGFDAHVGERGVTLSGGQRQRIALARVILKDAPILVLDEATSALDSAVEAAVLETLYGVMAGKTVIAIAHRLSTIAQMDRIVVLDGGRIVETGTHTELLVSDGLYSKLWQHQSGGFIGAAAE